MFSLFGPLEHPFLSVTMFRPSARLHHSHWTCSASGDHPSTALFGLGALSLLHCNGHALDRFAKQKSSDLYGKHVRKTSRNCLCQGAAKGGVIKGGVCKRKRTHTNRETNADFGVSERGPKTKVNAHKSKQTQTNERKRKIKELPSSIETLYTYKNILRIIFLPGYNYNCINNSRKKSFLHVSLCINCNYINNCLENYFCCQVIITIT